MTSGLPIDILLVAVVAAFWIFGTSLRRRISSSWKRSALRRWLVLFRFRRDQRRRQVVRPIPFRKRRVA